MRIVVVTAAIVAGLFAAGASANAQDYSGGYPPQGSYGANYDQTGGWDVAPVPLNAPDRGQPAQPRFDDRHDHYAGASHHGPERGYARLERGYQMPRFWMSPTYQVSNWQFYGLSQPPYGAHWVRYYDAAVLVDGQGRVLQSVDDLDWDQPMGDRGDAYASGYDRSVVTEQRYGGMAPGSYYAPPAGVVQPRPMMPPPVVAWSAPPPPVTWGGQASTVVFQSAPVVTTTTTTTTTYVDEVATVHHAAAPRRVWHRPVRRVVRCCCLCTR